MILHYVAAAQIVLALIHNLMSGTTIRLLWGNALSEGIEEGSRPDPNRVLATYLFFGFAVASALLLLLPGVPSLVEVALGMSWCLVSVAAGVRSKARASGFYFGISTGALILIGSHT